MEYPVSFDLVVDKAVGLGGWKVDPSDPFKAPYTPEAAASAAISFYNWPADEIDRQVLANVVREMRDEDDRNPADYR